MHSHYTPSTGRSRAAGRARGVVVTLALSLGLGFAVGADGLSSSGIAGQVTGDDRIHAVVLGRSTPSLKRPPHLVGMIAPVRPEPDGERCGGTPPVRACVELRSAVVATRAAGTLHVSMDRGLAPVGSRSSRMHVEADADLATGATSGWVAWARFFTDEPDPPLGPVLATILVDGIRYWRFPAHGREWSSDGRLVSEGEAATLQPDRMLAQFAEDLGRTDRAVRRVGSVPCGDRTCLRYEVKVLDLVAVTRPAGPVEGSSGKGHPYLSIVTRWTPYDVLVDREHGWIVEVINGDVDAIHRLHVVLSRHGEPVTISPPAAYRAIDDPGRLLVTRTSASPTPSRS